jgi:hypothetical protein
MKLIVEVDENGQLYLYRESKKHYKRVKNQRNNRDKITLKDLDNDCACMIPNTCLVVNIKD